MSITAPGATASAGFAPTRHRAPSTPPGRLTGRLRALAERFTTPLLPADYLDALDPLLSGRVLRGRIVQIRPETRDAVTVLIRPGRGWRPGTPGQYLRIGVDVDGVRQWRAYSLTSPAGRADGCVSIAVTAVPGGVVSTHLVRRAAVGTLVHLDQPAGDFTLDRAGTAPAKLLFVTAGSGITPVMGMLRNLGGGPLPDIVVVHSARTAADVLFGGELRMMAARGTIRLVEVHTAAQGRLDPARLAELAGGIAARHTFGCGPNGFLDALEQHWATAGLADRLHTERFRPAVVATGEGGPVTFSVTGTRTEAAADQSLLAAGEAAGVLMPSGCRMGICFGCVAPLRSGAVRDLRDGTLTTAAEGDGVVIQTCISAAAGACDVAL